MSSRRSPWYINCSEQTTGGAIEREPFALARRASTETCQSLHVAADRARIRVRERDLLIPEVLRELQEEDGPAHAVAPTNPPTPWRRKWSRRSRTSLLLTAIP